MGRTQPKSVVKMPRIHAREALACLNKFIAQSKEALESCSKFDDIKMTEMPQFFDVASPEFLEVPKLSTKALLKLSRKESSDRKLLLARKMKYLKVIKNLL